MRLIENTQITKSLDYHLKNKLFLQENIFRPGSDKYFDLIDEVRVLYENDKIRLNIKEVEIIESDYGKRITLSNGERIVLEYPMINEAEYQGKKVEIGKPKTGGSKKWYVYVRNPKTGKIKKISYGSPDMGANWNNPEARKSFAARHQCDKKKDRTTAGYWACRAHKDFGKNVPGRFW
jgi:hypothetical protein